MTQLRHSTVLLTGAAGGFGHHLTRQLMVAGCRLVLTDLSADHLDALTDSLAPGPGEVVARLPADLASEPGCRDLVRRVEALGEDIDILINNAGIAHFGAFNDVPEDAWQRLLQVNLLSPMLLTQRFVGGMVARRRGHVLNISSAAGWAGAAGLAAYSATKFGLRGFSDSLRQEVKAHGVRVTTVYPFFSRTPILDAPNYGSLVRPPLPESLTTDPAEVVGAMVRGLERNRDHVFPDTSSRLLHLMVRFLPSCLPWLQRRLEKRLFAASPTPG